MICYNGAMRISRDLPQFTDEDVFLVVTGKQEAEVYAAGDGIIEKIASCKVEKPTFSDHEGSFRMRAHGGLTRSGSYEEVRKEKVLEDFIKEFRKMLKQVLVNRMPDRMYLFTPAYMVNRVRDALPVRMRNILKRTIRGNFYERHPFEILAKLRPKRTE